MARRGGGYLSLFSTVPRSPAALLQAVMCSHTQWEDLQRYAEGVESVCAGPVRSPLKEALGTKGPGFTRIPDPGHNFSLFLLKKPFSCRPTNQRKSEEPFLRLPTLSVQNLPSRSCTSSPSQTRTFRLEPVYHYLLRPEPSLLNL